MIDLLPWRFQPYFGYRPKGYYTNTKTYIEELKKRNNLKFLYIEPKKKYSHPLKRANFIGNKRHQFFNKKELPMGENFISSIPNGRFFQNNYIISIITHNNKILLDSSKDPREKKKEIHPIFSERKLPSPKVFNDNILVLSTLGAHDGYTHWMLDLLPKLSLLEENKISLDCFQHVIVNGEEKAYKKDSLQKIGIPMSKIIYSENGTHIKAKQLFFIGGPSLIRFHPLATNYLRQHFVPSVSKSPSKYIYISRSKARWRHLINEEKIIDFLVSRNFEIVFLEDHSINKQAQYFSEAKVIVSLTGASLGNLAFCQRNTNVIVIYSDTFMSTVHWFLADLMGLNFYCYIGDSVKPKKGHPKRKELDNDIKIDENLFFQTVDEIKKNST